MVKHTYCSAQRCSKIGKNGGNLKVGKANGWICKHSQVCWQNQVHDLNVRSIWFWSVSVNAWLKVLSCWEAPFCRSVAFQCEKQKLEELFFRPSPREKKKYRKFFRSERHGFAADRVPHTQSVQPISFPIIPACQTPLCLLIDGRGGQLGD